MLFKEDATYYAERIKRKEMSATQLVERALANIEALNPTLNAVIHVQEKEALEKAKAYDKELEGLTPDEVDEFPPFYGVPILLKDLGQEEAGQPATSGASLMDGYIPEETDNFVKAVLAGGFIVVGRTNVPELGFKNETDAVFTGPTNSPYDPSLNPGGSSGGAAAALKAGIVPIVTASDGGGSIRIPASFNGLIGLKPSRGRTPVGPGSYRGWQGASIHFALTKSIRDTWAMLKVMQVEQYNAPFILPLIEEDRLEPLHKPLKFAYSIESPIHEEVSAEATKAVEVTVEALKNLGHEAIEDTPQTDGLKAMETYYIVNGVETAAMMENLQAGMNRPIKVEDMEPMSWGLYRSGLNISGVEYSQVLSFWDQLTAQMEAFFEKYDALVLPSTNGPAFPHNHFKRSEELLDQLRNIDTYDKKSQQELIWKMFEKSLAYTPFTQQQNLTGQPAISLPLYETADDLPVGTQIWTRKGAEVLLLQIAKQLEEDHALKTAILDNRV